MKNIVITALAFLVAFSIKAQTLDEVEIKTMSFAEKKMRKAPKRLYIAEFEINYQLMANFTETAQGGRQLGGSYRGDATATLILGVPDIDVDALQANTDKLYSEYVEKMEAAGFEIISSDEAAKTDLYSEWTKMTGGTPSEAQNPGYIQTTPKGYGYYKQKIKKGRAKTSMFYAQQLIKLSRQMDDAFVATVKINVPVFEDAESGASKSLTKMVGGVAKVVARANYRLTPAIAVQTGKFSGEVVQTQVAFYYSNQAQGIYTLKKDASIRGVFDNEKKYKASQAADVDNWGSQMGALTVFNPTDLEMKSMQKVECDPVKYVKGAELASKQFVDQSLDLFFEALTK